MREGASVSKTARIVLIDDHPIVLVGLRNLIATADDLRLVGEAGSGVSGLKLIHETKPDVAVLDISMPDMSGIALAARLREDGVAPRLLALSVHEDRAYLTQAFQAGIQGYVLKRSAAEVLIPAIRAVLSGGSFVDPSIAGVTASAALPSAVGPRGRTGQLTERETQVLRLTARGLTNKEIAHQIGVSVKSVETYKARGSQKLALKTRAEIVRYAAGQGWLATI